MRNNFNPNNLQPGDPVATDRGPAHYLEYREGRFRNQNHRIQLHNGETRWYTADQLRQANKREEVEV